MIIGARPDERGGRLSVGADILAGMFDEALAVGVAAFLEGDEWPTDDIVMARLEDAGVERWLVERLLVFLPLAFGRVVLGRLGARASDEFVDGSTPRLLADEPLFTAASMRAEDADAAELKRIGIRSSELQWLNSMLFAGSQPEDLVVPPVALPEPLTAAAGGDGGVPSPRSAFAAFLAGHGFAADSPQRVGELEFDARVFVHPCPSPMQVIAQVDFVVRHPSLARECLLESFAGLGDTWREALGQSIALFERASLHPIIAGLLDRSACQDQVRWESFAHPSGSFDLCLGPQITLFAQESAPPAGPLLDRLLEALRTVPLSRAVHWLRLFTCHQDGQLHTNGVLLDGEPWALGEATCASAPPPATSEMIGVRIFALLIPTP